MTTLRARFFPARVNKVSAHVALFRALPGSLLDVIVRDVESLTSKTMCFPIETGNVFLLNKGVAVNVLDGGRSRTMYEALRNNWRTFLSKQDQIYEPHYTIANKLKGEQDVRKCLEATRNDFHGSEGIVDGLALHRYDRGWWVDERVFWLQENKATDANAPT